MKMHVGVPRQPTILFRLVRVEVVQNDVNLTPAVLCNEIIHEIEKLSSSSPRIMAHLDLAGGDLQGGKQGTGTVSLVAMAESIEDFAIGQAEPSLCSLQPLNVRLFVDAEHDRVFRWTQVQADDICGLGSEFGIG